MARRVLGAHVVDRVDQPVPKNRAQTRLTAARAKYGLSGAVTQSARTVRGAEPWAATAGSLPSRKPAWTISLGAGDRQLAAVGHLAGLEEVESPSPRALDAGEEGGEAPELLALPVRERVVVALGAFEPDRPGRPAPCPPRGSRACPSLAA